MTTAPAGPPKPSERTWFAVLAVASGLLAAAICVDYDPGVNLVIVGAFMGAAVLMVARHSLGPVEWVLGITGFIFLTMFAVRTSEVLLFVDLCGAAGLASLALARGATWPEVAIGSIAVLTKLHKGVLTVLSPIRDVWGGFDRVARAPIMRGSAIGLSLAVVFGVLFASADRAFAQIIGDALVPEWDLGLLPFKVVAALVTVSFTGGYALVATDGPPAFIRAWSRPVATERRRPARAEWVIPLALIDLVFLSFVIIQIAVLFGGHDHVLSTAGLTYAEYAREGFFQLMVIAALSLAVIAAAVHFGAPEPSERRLMQVLLGALCALTLVVLVSALRRLGLYEEAFGFTRLRFAGHVVILWMSAVIVSVMVAGALWRAVWVPRVTVGLAAVALLVVNVMNPDAFIAKKNIDRFEATGKIDTAYLADLSVDAVPVLVDLPAEIRSCVLAGHRSVAFDAQPFWTYNVGRDRARAALSGISGSLGSLSECAP